MPSKLLSQATRMLTEYSIANSQPSIIELHDAPHTWTPPPTGFLKLNVDAGYSTGTKIAKLSFVLRDENGFIMVCGVAVCAKVSSVSAVELTAIKFGLEQIREFSSF